MGVYSFVDNNLDPFNGGFLALHKWFQSLGMPAGLSDFILMVITAVIITLSVVITVMLFVWAERKIIGHIQDRHGPLYVGPHGLLQSVADGIKLLVKEDSLTTVADRWVFNLAPVIVWFPVLMVFMVVPFGPNSVPSNLNIGVIYIIAVGLFSTVGVLMAGWGQNNRYGILGGMRGAAQMVSYEIPLVLSLLVVVMYTQSMSLPAVVDAQADGKWLIIAQPIAFFIYFTASLAELNRSPFDLPEAESELGAGYHTEYSGFKFSVFFLAEYGASMAVGAVAATLFLGGWRSFIIPLPGWLWILIKIWALFFVMSWLRGTVPRYRIDQLMALAWKFLLPLSLANIIVTGIALTIAGPNSQTGAFIAMAIGNWLLVGATLLIQYGRAQAAKHPSAHAPDGLALLDKPL